MITSAIVAPIHDLKFEYGTKFVSSYNQFYDDNDLYLVFSSQKDIDTFNKRNSDLRYNSILWNEGINYSKPISQKKFFGVDYVFKNTNADKVATVDVDSIFIKTLDYDQKFKDIIDSKKLYATKSELKYLLSKNASFFSKEERTKIQEKTDNFSLYFWFNNICLYEKSSFYTFLDHINYHSIKKDLRYEHFDFMMYAFYLLINDQIEIEELKNTRNTTKRESFIESQSSYTKSDFASIFTSYNPVWIKNLISENEMTNVFMQIHRDRP